MPFPCATCGQPKAGAHVCKTRLLKAYAGSSCSSEHVISMDKDYPFSKDVVPGARQIWDTALNNYLQYTMSFKERKDFLNTLVGTKTVHDYGKLTIPQRYAIVDQMWDSITEWVTPDKTPAQMFDAEPNDVDHTVSSTKVTKAFSTLGIGFRCEKEGDLPRILKDGFQPLYKTATLADRLGHHVRGTLMQTKTSMGQVALWKMNKDAVGQTGICVARGAMGASKFPTPDFVGKVYMFAVKPSNKGYDTEIYQKGKGRAAIWKPGEKLWPHVSTSDILAHVLVEKHGDKCGGGWEITVLADDWTYLRGTPTERAYLKAELQAMSPRTKVKIPAATYDWNIVT
ncbi:MAG TPA: hypothetical protein VM597_21030 [Gemmataceae bacterium]|jgi:hypothetical protein|nr:hypothetical protein [Gemmataceae bacterium]